jgi:hypothetical protein
MQCTKGHRREPGGFEDSGDIYGHTPATTRHARLSKGSVEHSEFEQAALLVAVLVPAGPLPRQSATDGTDQLKDNPTGVSDNASHHRRPTGKTIISPAALTPSM